MPYDFKSPEEHEEAFLREFERKHREKYLKGASDRGGKLWRKNTLPMVEEELLDILSYYWTHKAHVQEAVGLLMKAMTQQNWELVVKAKNILVKGNEEGDEEVELERG